MKYWVFTKSFTAIYAQQMAADTLPNDVSAKTGEETSIQITNRWAPITRLTDGRFTFIAKSKMDLPEDAIEVQFEDIADLFPAKEFK